MRSAFFERAPQQHHNLQLHFLASQSQRSQISALQRRDGQQAHENGAPQKTHLVQNAVRLRILLYELVHLLVERRIAAGRRRCALCVRRLERVAELFAHINLVRLVEINKRPISSRFSTTSNGNVLRAWRGARQPLLAPMRENALHQVVRYCELIGKAAPIYKLLKRGLEFADL